MVWSSTELYFPSKRELKRISMSTAGTSPATYRESIHTSLAAMNPFMFKNERNILITQYYHDVWIKTLKEITKRINFLSFFAIMGYLVQLDDKGYDNTQSVHFSDISLEALYAHKHL